jgi:predicted MFS family arabinose efflux permease
MLTVSIQSLLVLSIAKSDMALGTSLNTAFRYVGQTLGAPVAGAFLSTYVTSATMLPTRAAFQYCFYVSVAAFIIVGLVSTLAREVIGKDSSASTMT